jgi:hypothetical protein
MPPSEQIGDYGGVPALNLSGMTVADIEAAMPALTPEKEHEIQMRLLDLGAIVAQNNAAKTQAASVLAIVQSIVRIIGVATTLA